MSFQSVLDPAGPQSQRLYEHLSMYVVVVCAVYVIVAGMVLMTFFRRRVEGTGHQRPPEQDRRLGRFVTGATVITAIILMGFLVAAGVTGRNLSAFSVESDMVIQVNGQQWWWQVVYPNSDDASKTVVTANEIHIPVGRAVTLRLTSSDVIHSIWIPNLSGKRDLIPGRVNQLVIQADHPGIYRGQCAEFCGAQHAHMALYVVAEPPDKFEQWKQQQIQPAELPQTPIQTAGMHVFLNNPCVLCHSIRGTGAGGQNAPDLTHLASRHTLAAGTLPNTLGHLAGWITDSQSIKPGNRMPEMQLRPEDIDPLVQYLESLQ